MNYFKQALHACLNMKTKEALDTLTLLKKLMTLCTSILVKDSFLSLVKLLKSSMPTISRPKVKEFASSHAASTSCAPLCNMLSVSVFFLPSCSVFTFAVLRRIPENCLAYLHAY